jgi:lysophospholipase L1-like esterase
MVSHHNPIGAIALPTLLMVCSFPAFAQSDGPRGIVESPCPPAAAAPPEMKAMAEKMLAPGNKLNMDFFKGLNSGPGAAEHLKVVQEQRERDWADLCHYKAANAALTGKPRPEVVFMGDSITEGWAGGDPGYMQGRRVGRGVSGQTTPQMLVRFYADVIALRPRVVHIMGGTNDIGGNTGPTTLQDVKNNILAMVDLAQAHQVRVVLAGIPPSKYLWWCGIDPRHSIAEINAWLRQVADQRKLVYVDYSSVLADQDGGMKDTVSNDGVHPNRAGYEVMRPLAERAIAQAMGR